MGRVSEEMRRKHWVGQDADTWAFLDVFDEEAGGKVLEVGAHDEPVAMMLAEMGYDVWGVDLRDHDRPLPASGYTHVRHDFCDLPVSFLRDHLGSFDVAVSLSAIEHFGLGTYSEGFFHHFYDVIAVHTIWQMLKEGGVCYLTVPFGKAHVDNYPHWRVYDIYSLRDRLVQDFEMEFAVPFVSGDGVTLRGKGVTELTVLFQSDIPHIGGVVPHVSVIVKMRKVSKNRVAPDGR